MKRREKVVDNFTTLNWKTFECEICKCAYPLMVKVHHNGKDYHYDLA